MRSASREPEIRAKLKGAAGARSRHRSQDRHAERGRPPPRADYLPREVFFFGFGLPGSSLPAAAARAFCFLVATILRSPFAVTVSARRHGHRDRPPFRRPRQACHRGVGSAIGSWRCSAHTRRSSRQDAKRAVPKQALRRRRNSARCQRGSVHAHSARRGDSRGACTARSSAPLIDMRTLGPTGTEYPGSAPPCEPLLARRYRRLSMSRAPLATALAIVRLSREKRAELA
jgi:hypothetical protein